MLEHVIELEHLGDLAHPPVDLGLGDAAIAQREGEIVVDRHRVVDDRELEHLGDIALLRRRLGHIGAVEQDAAFGRPAAGPRSG